MFMVCLGTCSGKEGDTSGRLEKLEDLLERSKRNCQALCEAALQQSVRFSGSTDTLLHPELVRFFLHASSFLIANTGIFRKTAQ